jgi:hypothetical protein
MYTTQSNGSMVSLVPLAYGHISGADFARTFRNEHRAGLSLYYFPMLGMGTVRPQDTLYGMKWSTY